MKNINKIGVFVLSITIVILSWSCDSADKEFVHTKNTINKIFCKALQDGSEFEGKIYEYNKDGELMTGTFTQEDIEGGYGLVLFAISKSLADDVDLTNLYITANVSYDQFITPSLSGKHDISGDGMIISVKSGVGTERFYRLRGFYE